MVGHWYGGLGACRRACLRAVCRGVGLVAGDGGRDRLGHPAGDGGAGLPEALRRRRHHHLGLARHPDPAVDRDGALRGRRPTPRSASCSSPASCPASCSRPCSARRPGTAPAQRLSAHAEGVVAANASHAFRESIWGLLLIVIVIGGIYTGLFTPTEAAAMSAVYAFFVAVFVYKDLKLQRRAAGAAVVGQPERDAALHHHQRGAVLVPDDLREHPAGAGALDDRPGPRLDRLPAGRQRPAAARRQRDGAVVDHR